MYIKICGNFILYFFYHDICYLCSAGTQKQKKHKNYNHKIKILDNLDIQNKRLFESYNHFLEYIGEYSMTEDTKNNTEPEQEMNK